MNRHEEIADVLDGAADVIERDGWYQGWLVNDEGAVCAMGAMGRVCGLIVPSGWVDHLDTDGPEYAKLEAARSALWRVLPPCAEDAIRIPVWNDAPERTKQEVLDAFRFAAKQERRAADSEAGAL